MARVAKPPHFQAPEVLASEEFSAIIGAIYECVLEPTDWPATLDRIRAAIGGRAAWLALHYPDQIRSVYEIEVGTDAEQQQRLRSQYLVSSPFIGTVHYVKPGDVLATGDVVDYDEFRSGRFYREWAQPQGWLDFLMGVLDCEADRFSWLGVCLPAPASADQKARMRALLPHIARALRISHLLEARAVEAENLAAVLTTLETGLILVDARMQLRGINPAAERLLAETAGFRVDGGRLDLPHSDSGAQLEAALRACADHQIDDAGASVLFAAVDGELGLLAHVLPLARASVARDDAAVAAIFLTNPAAPQRPSLEAFIEHYGLTPSETRVLIAIMEGKSPRAIAAAQGVAMPTVRTHLSRLYEKTGTKGQTDVVRLMASVTRTV